MTNPYATATLTEEQRQVLTNDRDSFVVDVASHRAMLRRYLDEGVTDLGILHRTVEAMAEAQASVDAYDAGLAVLDAGHDPATTLADLVEAVTSPAKFSGVLGTAQAGVQTQVLRRFVTRLTRWGYFGKEE